MRLQKAYHIKAEWLTRRDLTLTARIVMAFIEREACPGAPAPEEVAEALAIPAVEVQAAYMELCWWGFMRATEQDWLNESNTLRTSP